MKLSHYPYILLRVLPVADACFKLCQTSKIPVGTRRRFNVYKTSIRRRQRLIDVEKTSCVYWDRAFFEKD